MENTNLTDAPEIPEELATELRKRDFHDYKIINVNMEKGRYNLLATAKDGRSLFIKCNDSKVKGWKPLQKEKEIYRFLEGEPFIPTVIYSENILAVEYIEDSCTLRDLLLRNDDVELFSCLIRDVIVKYRLFLWKMNKYPVAELKTLDKREALNASLRRAIVGGPYGSKIYKIERFLNRRIIRLLRKWYADQIDLSENTCTIHGDFHLNNILVADRKTYIIDLENVVRGNAAVDLAYWYVQIWVLVYQNQEMLSILEKEIKSIFDMEMIDEREFYMIVKLYQMAILLNRRFHRHEKKAEKAVLINKLRELNEMKFH